jgi:transposase
MFVRLKTSKNSKHATVQIVKSVRTSDKKVKQEIIASLGVIRSDEDKAALLKLAHNLIQKFSDESSGQLALGEFDYSYKPKDGKRITPDQIDYRNLSHVKDYQIGFDEVFGKISEDVGFDSILADIDNTKKHSYSAQEIIKKVVINRLKEPDSKRASFLRDLLENGETSFELHHVYRAMDLLVPYIDKFQTQAHLAAVDLFPEVKSYFYDATTLFYESVVADDLKNFGFSKDCKFNQVQIVICLLVTSDGLPIGYELFSGNTAETKTLKTAIENLSKRYNVKNHTIVCDRGMLSNDNLTTMNSSDIGMYYIVGEKLRKLPKEFQEIVFNEEGYDYFGDTRVKILTHPTRENAKLILAHSEDRAKKDKSDRDRLIKKLQKRFEKKKSQDPKSFVNNYGTKKFISFTGGEAKLNLEMIATDERWDGYFGIVTNNPDLTKNEVLGQYRGLWQVEANFRVFKNDIAARPIYHWSENRIKAHVLICFMALVLERHLYAKLKKSEAPLTTTNIHNALRSCKKIVLQDSKNFRLFELSTNKPIEAKQIYETVGLDWRSQTIELPNPNKSVVPSLSVKKAKLL